MATRHFKPTFFKFMRDLKANNDRTWFQENRDRYLRDVRDPALAFITDFGAGIWLPDTPTVTKFRQAISDHTQTWRYAVEIEQFKQYLKLPGKASSDRTCAMKAWP